MSQYREGRRHPGVKRWSRSRDGWLSWRRQTLIGPAPAWYDTPACQSRPDELRAPSEPVQRQIWHRVKGQGQGRTLTGTYFAYNNKSPAVARKPRDAAFFAYTPVAVLRGGQGTCPVSCAPALCASPYKIDCKVARLLFSRHGIA